MGQICGKEKSPKKEGKGKDNGNVEGLTLKPVDPENVTSVVNENITPEAKPVTVNVNTFENPDVIEEAKTPVPGDLPEPPQDLSEENSTSKPKESPKTPRNSAVEPANAVINNEIPKADIVDKLEAEKPNDNSVLAFGDGDPNIPSDMVTGLVIQHLEKMDDDDDKKDVDQKEKKDDAGDSELFFGDGDPKIPSDNVIGLVTNHLDEMEEKKGAVGEEKIDPSFTVVDKADAEASKNDNES